MAHVSALIILLLSFSLLNVYLAIPVDKSKKPEAHKLDDGIVGLNEEEYKRYVEQIRQMHLSQVKKGVDDTFTPEQVDKKMAPNDEHLRTKLEEAKRQIVDNLRNLGRLRQLKQEGLPVTDQEIRALNLAGVSKDLKVEEIDKIMHEKLEVLQALDNKRKELFKEHEMGIEAKRREKLKKMSERDRLKAEEEYKKEEQKKKAHELPHPASKEQLQDVWEKEDEMPKEDFEPKKFFLMHDTNGDQYLDPLELEAMFYGEVKNVYDEDHDQTEIREEMSRMREHVMKEIDKNLDGMISVEEFMRYTDGTNYEKDKDWEDIDDEDTYTDEEMEEYMKMYGHDIEDDDDDEDDHKTATEHHEQGDHGALPDGHGGQATPHHETQNQHQTNEGAHATQEHVEKTQEHTEKPQEHTEKPQEHTEKPQEHTEKPQEHTEKPQEHTEKPQEHTEKPQEHTEKPQEHTEKPQEQVHHEQPQGHHPGQQNDPNAI